MVCVRSGDQASALDGQAPGTAKRAGRELTRVVVFGGTKREQLGAGREARPFARACRRRLIVGEEGLDHQLVPGQAGAFVDHKVAIDPKRRAPGLLAERSAFVAAAHDERNNGQRHEPPGQGVEPVTLPEILVPGRPPLSNGT